MADRFRVIAASNFDDPMFDEYYLDQGAELTAEEAQEMYARLNQNLRSPTYNPVYIRIVPANYKLHKFEP